MRNHLSLLFLMAPLPALAHVGPVNAPEFADTVSTDQILQPAAEQSGGFALAMAVVRIAWGD